MAKSFRIKNGKILVYEEIEITDYSVFLKYDWHLYNLSKDLQNARDARFRSYLKKAKGLFADEVSKSKPNKRVDLFGPHSVFYYLYGHTGDWVKAAKEEATYIKDLLVCVSGDNVNKMLVIIRHSSDQKEAGDGICKSFGIQPSSSARILSLSVNKILGIEPDLLKMQYEEAKVFLERVTELEQTENENQ